MNFNDSEWLGNADERLGPAIRAAVGLLLKQGDWSWYYRGVSRRELRDKIYEALEAKSFAVWGGDEAVLSLSTWLDPWHAIDIGQVLLDVSQAIPFRLKISREVWGWDNGTGAPIVLKDDLAKALPGAQIFYDWPKARRPRRPYRDGQSKGLIITSAAGGKSQETAASLTEVLPSAEFRPVFRGADILVANSLDELRSERLSGELVIVLGNNPRDVAAQLDEVRTKNAARCVLFVPQNNADDWLRSFGSMWASEGLLINEAVYFANLDTGQQAEIVATNQTFLLRSRAFLTPRPVEYGQYDFGPVGSSSPRQRTSRGSNPDEAVAFSASDRAPRLPPPSKRMIETRVWSDGRIVTRWPKRGVTRISVSIVPKTPSRSDQPDFPENLILWKGNNRVLQVHLVELDRMVQSAVINLPRRGRSSSADFDYKVVNDEEIDIRFMICDEVQILQTARLKGRPGETIEFFIEADFVSVEKNQRPFDLALMVNDSLGGRPSATSVTRDGVKITKFEGHLEAIRDKARSYLAPIVTSPDMPESSLQKTLMRLAIVGSELLQALQGEIGTWPAELQRVQLNTKGNAFFPFEFLYDAEVPDDPDAPLCSERVICLRGGREQGWCCPIRDQGEVLCPMGFLGLRTIIERQAWDDKQEGTLWIRQSAELTDRHGLKNLENIAFAASDIADKFLEDDDLPPNHNLARIQTILDELDVERRESWKAWGDAVNATDIAMGILVAHIDDTTLFIGKDTKITRVKLTFGRAPVAILLGCNSAINVIPATSLPTRILEMGHTKVVISALTDILGRHANTAALYLGKNFREASKRTSQTSVGDFVIEMRRGLLADDIAMGLILVALGDADVALGG